MANVVFETDQPMGALGGDVPFAGEGDPRGAFYAMKGMFRSLEKVRIGTVSLYNPTTKTATVSMVGTQSKWPCIFADEPLSYTFGFSSVIPAREGDLVLVIEPVENMQSGIIIGRIPYEWDFSMSPDRYSDPDQYHRRLYTQDEKERKTWDRNIRGLMKPLEDENENSTSIRTHFRPTDVYPGEFAHVNQHNCGLKGGLFSMSLLGGGAVLRLSALSNSARLSSETYLRYTMTGNVKEFHNGRYLSAERDTALYQEERLGGTSSGAQVWEDDAIAPKGGENQTIRPRIKELSGFFGHLMSRFFLRPDQTESGVRVQGEGSPVEEGVGRETFDPSGQYRLSAAGMIAIERTGRIPVPVRKSCWSENGHQIDEKPEVLAPFEHSEKDPYYRPLELFDRQAYDLKNQYARVDGRGFEENSDYEVPQEEDMSPLKDKYDEKFDGNATVRLSKYDKRRAGAYIGEDGSIIIRDAWGSEVVMIGGNVTISCAGNVMTLPGQTALTIAGDDIVHKAQNSVDIHASKHDVRLSATRNMEIVGGGDENNSGGVVIESRGKGVSPWDGKDKGEDARLSGITLRTRDQGVVIDGKRVQVRSRKDTRIISGDDDIDGNISFAAKNIRSRARYTIVSNKDGTSHVYVSGSGAGLVAKSVGLLAERSLVALKGEKYPAPLMWVDVDNVAADMSPKLAEVTKDLENEKDAAAGFDKEQLEKMMFGFRKSVECRTDRSWGMGRGDEAFKLYQPAWAQVSKVFETLRSAHVDSTAYEEPAEWENGRPFPGKESENSAKYAKLNGDPKNLTSDGFNASRKGSTLKNSSSITEVPLKGGYLVRK